MKTCLQDRLGLIWSVSDSWDVFFLFGVWDESRVRNAALCRFLLSHARLAVKLRRNMAHYDHVIHPVWPIFNLLDPTDPVPGRASATIVYCL